MLGWSTFLFENEPVLLIPNKCVKFKSIIIKENKIFVHIKVVLLYFHCSVQIQLLLANR